MSALSLSDPDPDPAYIPSCLVGATGFVGSNLRLYRAFDRLYHSRNFHEAAGHRFGTVFFCGMPAEKHRATADPATDRAVLDGILSVLRRVRTDQFVLISTIDVYAAAGTAEGLDEDANLAAEKEDEGKGEGPDPLAYGRHRRMLEEFVRETFSNHYILRLPALFGRGLKKNLLYDLLHDHRLEAQSLHTVFQWYSMDWLHADIEAAVASADPEARTRNLFPAPLATRRVLAELFPDVDPARLRGTAETRYDTRTRVGVQTKAGAGGYCRSAEESLAAMAAFVTDAQRDKSRLMVSNICTHLVSPANLANALRLFGIPSVQVAPTLAQVPEEESRGRDPNPEETWRKLCARGGEAIDLEPYLAAGIRVVSLQSITFGLADWGAFDPATAPALLAHLLAVLAAAVNRGAELVVFGAPRNRRLPGPSAGLDGDAVDAAFVRFARILGDYLEYLDSISGPVSGPVSAPLIICIEPNSEGYGCNYLTTVRAAGRLVRAVAHPRVRLMVDAGNIAMEAEGGRMRDDVEHVAEFADVLHHADAANPYMRPLLDHTSDEWEPRHRAFRAVLDGMGYTGRVNLEMRAPDGDADTELAVIRESLANFVRLYAD